MDIGYGFLHGAGNVDVVVAVEARMNATLQADFGRADTGGLDTAPRNLVEVEEIRRTP